MYYPYLRGKQFDLLALEYLIKEQRLSSKIHPIIEPVRDSKTTRKVIEFLDQKNVTAYIIENPQVGTYKLLAEKLYPWQISTDTTLKRGMIVTSELLTDTLEADLLILDKEVSPKNAVLKKALQKYKMPMLIPDEGRYRTWVNQQILLKQAYQPRRRVSDYEEKTDDFFTDDHLYFAKDGYLGFSDYAIDGKKYYDKGGPSRAIALHITYIDAYLNLRIKHFVSDSNENAQNQSQKFFEALEKLVSWYSKNQDQLLLTGGLENLLTYHKTQKFPGLGSIKKWSLAHHLELVGAFLDYGEYWKERNIIDGNDDSSSYCNRFT